MRAEAVNGSQSAGFAISPAAGAMPADPSTPLRDTEYEELYRFRARLLRFLRASDRRIQDAGLTPSQYLLLLGVRAHSNERGPTIGDMAEFLQVKHHSAVELIDRAARADLVVRREDPDDGRVVRLALTFAGTQLLERVASINFRELRTLELISDVLDVSVRP